MLLGRSCLFKKRKASRAGCRSQNILHKVLLGALPYQSEEILTLVPISPLHTPNTIDKSSSSTVQGFTRTSQLPLSTAFTLLHPALRPSFGPIVHYDVRCSPTTLRIRHHSLSLDILHEPAVTPPVSRLCLVSSRLLWSITVNPTQLDQNGIYYVSVLDVFMAIYTSLKIRISLEDYNEYGERPRGILIQKKAALAFEERCGEARSSEACAAKRRQGMRRVDFLLGRTRFIGLAPSPNSSEEWVLVCD